MDELVLLEEVARHKQGATLVTDVVPNPFVYCILVVLDQLPCFVGISAHVTCRCPRQSLADFCVAREARLIEFPITTWALLNIAANLP